MQSAHPRRLEGRKEILKKITFGEILTLFAVVLMALALIFSVLHFNLRMDDSQTVSADCEVVDKYYQSGFRGNKTYYLELLFTTGQVEFTDTITISKGSFYQDVQIGDQIPCEVTYDENGIIDIAVTDSSIEQHSVAKGRTGLVIMLAAFILLLGVTVVVCIIKK